MTAQARGSKACGPCSTKPRSSHHRRPNQGNDLVKLLTNMSLSVLCLLTGHTARAVRDDPALREVVPRLLDEANNIASKLLP